jgi:hypothetical protein
LSFIPHIRSYVSDLSYMGKNGSDKARTGLLVDDEVYIVGDN